MYTTPHHVFPPPDERITRCIRALYVHGVHASARVPSFNFTVRLRRHCGSRELHVHRCSTRVALPREPPPVRKNSLSKTLVWLFGDIRAEDGEKITAELRGRMIVVLVSVFQTRNRRSQINKNKYDSEWRSSGATKVYFRGKGALRLEKNYFRKACVRLRENGVRIS